MTDRALTIVLAGAPYGTERAFQALRLAEAALERGHRVNLFATGDGTYAALSGQSPAGLPNIGEQLRALIERGLRVELCGSCLRFRGLAADRLVPGARPGSLKRLGGMLQEAGIVVSF